MIKISIFYPNKKDKDSFFDMDYYLNKHMPMSIELLSAHPGFRGVSVERGVGGGAPGADATYIVMCNFLFDSAESVMAAFTPNRPVLQGDMQNYTNIQPIIQFSEVVISK